MALDLINKARRGNHYTTWKFIYYCRKNNKTKAPSHDSEMILRWLIKYGHMPSCAVTNVTPSAPVMAIKDIEAHDDGDIHISITLQKKGNIKDALALLGENLSLYCQNNRDNTNDKDLDLAVIDSKFQAISIGFDKDTKKTTDMQRAAGLWLFDRMKGPCPPTSISIAMRWSGLVGQFGGEVKL